MSDFVKIVRGTEQVSSAQALFVFELLGPVVQEAPEPGEALTAAFETVNRIPRNDVTAIVLDWWLVTMGENPPHGHAFNLPESIPHPLRGAMKGITDLTHAGLPLPPAKWLLAARRLDELLDGLDGRLSLDSYGSSKVPSERDVWSYLVDELDPVVSALMAGKRAEPVEFDERAYLKEMKQDGIEPSSRRWAEMVKRAHQCVEYVNEVVGVQLDAEPWVQHELPQPMDEVPDWIVRELGPLHSMLLNPVLNADASDGASGNDEAASGRRAVLALEAAEADLGVEDLSWLTLVVDGWPTMNGVESEAMRGVRQRQTAVGDRIEHLRELGEDCDDAEILLLDHDLQAAEDQLDELEAQRKKKRRREVVASRVQQLRTQGGSGPWPDDWEERLCEADSLLAAGDNAAAETLVQELDRQLKLARRVDAIGELEQIHVDLVGYGAPTSVANELSGYLAELASLPERTVDSQVVQRSMERLETLAAQRYQEVAERRGQAQQILDEESDLIASDALDSAEFALTEVESALDGGSVMEALELVEELLADLDGHRVHRWTLAEGEEALVDHVVTYCTQQLHFDPEDVRRLLVAAKTKPFVILAGLTGSGKSTIARLFAAALGADTSNGRYRRVAVRPDWIDQSEVLGSINPFSNRFEPGWLAEVARQCERNLDQLHVVLLDEMNLAPVEQYLAEYLSAIEEARSGSEATMLPLYSAGADPENGDEWPSALPFPRNLITIGTVNIDETTRVLSERVLDRANVLQLSVAISDAHHGSGGRAVHPWLVPFQEWDRVCVREPSPDHHDFLIEVGQILLTSGIGVGQRAHVELERFIANSDGLLEPTMSLDLGILQRFIPKIRGFKRDLEPGLIDLREVLTSVGCDKSARVVAGWLDERVPDDEYIDGTDARVGLL